MSALVIHNTHELHQLKKALPLLRGMQILAHQTTHSAKN